MKPRKLLLLGICILGFTSSYAQTRSIPKFDQYKVNVSKTKPKPPNLNSHKYARLFKTNLRNATKKGVNFSGHFVISYWGHGAGNCIVAITNTRNGQVFFPERLFNSWSYEWPKIGIPLRFQRNSSLLVMKGYESNDLYDERKTYGMHYYVWTGSNLQQIRFDKINREDDGN